MYRDLFRSVDIIEEFYKNDKEADKFAPQMKHMNQQNKIVDWMKDHGLLEVKKDVDRVYIEYGAGRAGLSSYVADRIDHDIGEEDENKDNIKFIIVDRDTRRGKLDKNFREKFATMREKMDIADFDLEKFMHIKQQEKEIKNKPELLCIAKHLCGGATDLSLTSIIDKHTTNQVVGFAIATCCHHSCDQRTFVNLDLLKSLGGFTSEELVVLPRLSSWAVSSKTNLSRRCTGFKTKRILDYCRIQYIQ